MNAHSRKEEFFVKEEDWESHGYTHPLRDNPIGSKLTNDIHSMFSYELKERPPGGSTKARWGELTMEEYELLEQPLRLATQWLQSAPSSDAICSVIDGDRYIPQDNPMHQSIPVSEFRHHSLPASVMHESAGSALKRLGTSISFQATKRDTNMGLGQEDHGQKSPVLSGYPEGVAITHRPELKGLASITFIHPVYLFTLRQLLLEPERNKSQILKLYFEFALTICHEVIHAINFAVESELLKSYIEMGFKFNKVPFNEPFYEGQRVAELGFFWETEVFGGVCKQSPSDPEDPIFLADWPSLLVRNKGIDPERAPPRNMCYKYLVSTYYIQNSQTLEFWDKVKLEHSQDLLTLRIRKRVGMVCYLPPGEDYDRTWDRNAPENAPKLVGNFRWVLPDDPDPSPCAKLANETIEERTARLDAERQAISPF